MNLLNLNELLAFDNIFIQGWLFLLQDFKSNTTKTTKDTNNNNNNNFNDSSTWLSASRKHMLDAY